MIYSPESSSAAGKLRNKEELYLSYKMPIEENRSFYLGVLFLL